MVYNGQCVSAIVKRPVVGCEVTGPANCEQQRGQGTNSRVARR